MAFICSISGVVPDDPVVSKTGYIFEKRLIEEYIRCNNTCPITKSELSLEDLIRVKSPDNIKPRLIKNASIPGILDSLRIEWDSLMLEMFQIRSELEQAKAQLTHSLYQHDAACRVIARITRERDEALGRLEIAQRGTASDENNAESKSKKAKVDEHFVDIPKELGTLLEEYSEKMRPIRKKQTFPELKPCNQVEKFALKTELNLQTDSKLTCGFFFNDQIYISGLENGEILISHIDCKSGISLSAKIDSQNLGNLTCISASGSVGTQDLAISETPSRVFASFQDSGKIHIFSNNSKDQPTKFKHSSIQFGPSSRPNMLITGIELHPLGTLLVANSQNEGVFSMLDVESEKQVLLHSLGDEIVYSELKIHPDGLILGGISPSGNSIDIWDIRNTQKTSTLEIDLATNKLPPISSICFSNNGYYLFSTSTDHKIHLWDLRKSSVLDSLDLTLPSNPSRHHRIKADLSGKYISHFAGTQLSVFSLFNKHKLLPTCTLPLPDPEDYIQDIQLLQNLSHIYSIHKSGIVRVWTDVQIAP